MRLCDPDDKPAMKKTCLMKPCYEWHTDKWSECSSTCGHGFMTRRVFCFDILANSTSDFCDKNDMPKTFEICNLQDCPIKSELGKAKIKENFATVFYYLK